MPPVAQSSSPMPAPIGPGDFLDVSEYHTPDFHSAVRVSAAGAVILPMIGEVNVSAMDEQSAARAIEAALLAKGMLLHPLVSVLVTGYAGQDVSVLGEVTRPGVYPYTYHHRLLDLISAASGLSPNAGRLVNVFHQADPKTAHPVVLDPSGTDTTADHNPELSPGDTVQVSRAGLVYVVGDVIRPGGFAVDPVQGLTAVQALSLAWGPSQNAAAGRAVLIRGQKGGRTMIALNLKRMLHGQDPDQSRRGSRHPLRARFCGQEFSEPDPRVRNSIHHRRHHLLCTGLLNKVLAGAAMRRIAWVLLLVFAFAIPWEYSLDLGEPLGNVARIAGLLALLAAVPAVFQAGRMRNPGAFCWLTLVLYLSICCSYFWTIDDAATLEKIRSSFQEVMIVWLVWEFADTPADLRGLLRAFVAGSWVLAALTLVAFRSPEAIAAGQFRFAAYGQDPNDVARFLDLGFPFAALLLECEHTKLARLLALGFLPVGLVAVLLTASRSGFLAALVALAGSAVLLTRGHPGRVVAGVFALPPFLAALWFIVPSATFARLATIPEQLRSGDLNQRLNIWSAGWRAFIHAPLFGTGAGSFVAAAHLSPIDTAHNTALSIAVGGGLCALSLATLLVALAACSAIETHGPLRVTLITALSAWAVTSLAATVEESRTTWLLFAVIALAARLATEDPNGLAASFRASPRVRHPIRETLQACGGVTPYVT